MNQKMRNYQMLHRKAISVIVVFGLLAGLLPAGKPQQAKAAGYGLNNPIVSEDGTATWDCVWFGNYWQNDTNGDGKADQNDAKEPIKWRVLSVDGDDAFLLADQNLYMRRYNDTRTEVTWETCTMRKWLNSKFLENAFSEAEQDAIETTIVVNEDSFYGTEGGNDTSDKVYLLSVEEAANSSYGFASDMNNTKTRETKYTDRANDSGGNNRRENGRGEWWLRSSGGYPGWASYVSDYGMLYSFGHYADLSFFVRPALHLKLSSVEWNPAGTVSSTGEESVIPAPAAEPTISPALPTKAPSFYGLSDPLTANDGTVTWDCVWFGNYWQNDTNGDGVADQKDEKEPIKWRVLSVDGNDAFLLADQNLDAQCYNDESIEVTWETCTMRNWLNSEFLGNAFSEGEQDAVETTIVVNNDNPLSGAEGGNDTSDKVYLLSIGEAADTSYGFTSAYLDTKARKAKNTDYVKDSATDVFGAFYSNGEWWLRSPGFDGYGASYVGSKYNNFIENLGLSVFATVAVRPALHLDLSSAKWSPAGTVSSSGEESVIPAASAKPSATLIPSVEPTETPLPPANEPTGKPSETLTPSVEPTSPLPTKDLSGPTMANNGVVTWDCVWFGNYWQNDTNGDGKADQKDEKEPIKWRVLSVDGDDVFLLADQNLDLQSYNTTHTDVRWETCTIRSWLNSEFLENAFSIKEQGAIKTTTVVNEDNPLYGTKGGNNTSDKVYLLSIDEVMNPAYGFTKSYKDTKVRQAKNTVYTKDSGAFTFQDGSYADGSYVGNSNWWLRSPGAESYGASYVSYGGYVYREGAYVDSFTVVRPALHLELSSSMWSPAGTVNSLGEESVIPAPSAEPTEEPVISTEPTEKPPAASTKPGEQETDDPTGTPTEKPTPSDKPTENPPSTSAQPGGQSQAQGPSVVSSAAPTPDTVPIITPDDDSTAEAPAKVSKLKGKAKKKAVKLSWKKVSAATGYEIWVSTSKKFKKKKVKTTKAVKLTVKKLKAKKKYFIKVRAYIMKDGKKVYGKWSRVIKVKTK